MNTINIKTLAGDILTIENILTISDVRDRLLLNPSIREINDIKQSKLSVFRDGLPLQDTAQVVPGEELFLFIHTKPVVRFIGRGDCQGSIIEIEHGDWFNPFKLLCRNLHKMVEIQPINQQIVGNFSPEYAPDFFTHCTDIRSREFEFNLFDSAYVFVNNGDGNVPLVEDGNIVDHVFDAVCVLPFARITSDGILQFRTYEDAMEAGVYAKTPGIFPDQNQEWIDPRVWKLVEKPENNLVYVPYAPYVQE